MITTGKIVIAIISNDLAVDALINSQVYPLVIPESTDLPAVVVERTFDNLSSKDGDTISQSTFNITVISEKYRETVDIAFAIRNALTGYKDSIIRNIRLVSGSENYTEGAFIQVMTFAVITAGDTTLLPSEDLEITSDTEFTTTENTTSVGTITASRQSSFYIVAGANASLFSINISSGVLTWKVAPDFDAWDGNPFEVTVRAVDAFNMVATRTISVSVSNVDEPPVITSPDTFMVEENSTYVGVVTFVDPENNAVVFAITGGDDADKFSINVDTGELSFISAPDFDFPGSEAGTNNYYVKVRATDSTGQYAEQDITVVVTDVNYQPVITSSSSFSVVENTTSVGMVSAHDPDGDAVIYSITGGADAGKFNINQNTGAITFKTAPNFEAPGSAASSNVYSITVRATDPGGQYAEQDITITVINEIDNPILISKQVLSDGYTVELLFNKVMANPATHYNDFSIKDHLVISAALKTGNSRVIVLTLSTQVSIVESVEVSFISGNIKSIDNELLESFTASLYNGNMSRVFSYFASISTFSGSIPCEFNDLELTVSDTGEKTGLNAEDSLTLSAPFDPDVFNSDELDLLWSINYVFKRDVTPSELIAKDFNSTLVKYDNSGNITRIAILRRGVTLTSGEKALLTTEFALHPYYWGSYSASGTVKTNRPSYKPVYMLRAFTRYDGDSVKVKFSGALDSIASYLSAIHFKVNGVAKGYVEDVEFSFEDFPDQWNNYTFALYESDGVTQVIFQPGDEITIDFDSTDIKDANGNKVIAANESVYNILPDPLSELESTPDGTFAYAHGTVRVGDYYFLGIRQASISTPTKIVKINLTDLSDVEVKEFGSFHTMESLCYDSVNNRIYAVMGSAYTTDLTIYSINPDDLDDYSQLIAVTGFHAGNSPSICTDGVYVYGITYETNCKLFKFDLATKTVSTNTLTGYSMGHASYLKKFSNKIEFYVTCKKVATNKGVFLKVQSDLTCELLDLPEIGQCTDDFAVKETATGIIAYVVGEQFLDNLMYVIDSSDLSYTTVPCMPSYGNYVNGGYLYCCGMQYFTCTRGTILRYDLTDFTMPPDVLMTPTDGIPNEIIADGDDVWFTQWAVDNAHLIRTTFIQDNSGAWDASDNTNKIDDQDLQDASYNK